MFPLDITYCLLHLEAPTCFAIIFLCLKFSYIYKKSVEFNVFDERRIVNNKFCCFCCKSSLERNESTYFTIEYRKTIQLQFSFLIDSLLSHVEGPKRSTLFKF